MRFAFLIFFLFLSVVDFAGVGENSIVCVFEQKHVQVSSGYTLLTNTLRLSNRDTAMQLVHFSGADAGIRLFNATPVSLLPGEEKRILLKFSLPGNYLYSGYKTGVWCITASGDSSCIYFTLDMAQLRDLRFYTTDPAPVIDNAAPQNISLVIRNKGNIAERLKLHISGGNIIPDISFTLPAYTDTLIVADLHLLPEKNAVRRVLTTTLQDSTGQTISTVDIQPRIVRQALRMQPAAAIPSDNFASIQYTANNAGNNYREYQLSYNRNAASDGLILAAYAFDGTGLSAPNIANSYIGYRRGDATIKAGLLNLWGELPIYGQGGNITLGDTRRYVSASYLHNGNTYLSRETNSPGNETKNIHTTFGCDISDRLYANGIFLHQWHNPFNKDIYMGGASFQWQAGKNNTLEAACYGNTGETAIGQVQGAAAHIRFTGKGKRLQLFSDNYASTPNYAGILNNTQQLSENLTWRLSAKEDATGLSLMANYMHSDPATYNDHLQRIINLQVNEQYGAALSKNFRHLLLRVNPYYSRQQVQFGNTDLYTLSNWYIRADAQFSHKTFSASLNLIAALQSQQQGIREHIPPVRVQGFLQYKYFTLQGLYQYRPFFATDLQQEILSGKRFSIAGIGPGFRTAVLHRHLDLYGNYNLQYFSGNAMLMHSIFAGATARVSDNWQLSAAYGCTINSFSTYQDIRLGLRFLFARPSDMFTRRKTMVFYSDDNHNGRRDAREKAVPGILVGTETDLVRSGTDGSIKLLRCKNNTAALMLVNGNGYTAAGDINRSRFYKNKAFVPVYRMGMVSGRLKLLLPKHSRQSITVSGLPLVFTDEAGNKTTCYVQPGGDFSISLPAGRYTIGIAAALSDIYQLQQTPSITVTGKDIEQLSLEVKYSHAQPVETIQFSGKR